MARILQFLFFLFIVKPIVLIMIGVNIVGRNKLPATGPAIIAGNHNSHLDTLVLMSLFPLRQINRIRPVAAADYFLKNKLISWFSRKIIGIIPLDRKNVNREIDVLQGCSEALAAGNIIILFPEGSRGEAEKLSPFKKGISILSERHPSVPISPVFIHGLGKALPKGDFLLVPFFCDIIIDEPLRYSTNREDFMAQFENRIQKLSEVYQYPVWE